MSQVRPPRTGHHDTDAPTAHPANRLGINYRDLPQRRVDCRIVDIHSHVYAGTTAPTFFDAAALYGISRVITMAPLDHVPPLRAAYGERLGFIAIPRWRKPLGRPWPPHPTTAGWAASRMKQRGAASSGPMC